MDSLPTPFQVLDYPCAQFVPAQGSTVLYVPEVEPEIATPSNPWPGARPEPWASAATTAVRRNGPLPDVYIPADGSLPIPPVIAPVSNVMPQPSAAPPPQGAYTESPAYAWAPSPVS